MIASKRYARFVVVVFFVFMLLHQADRLLIGPMTSAIIDTFHITLTQMGAVSTGALIVGAVLYPIWGYLYDRYARSKLLALASFIWGSTTWLNALAPTYNWFLVTRASTGIDDSSYPGLYSLIADYFGPKMRGRIYGILQLTQPIGYLVGMILALTLGGVIGWRSIYFITGSLGVVMAAVIYFTVKEPTRGQTEPELADLEQMGIYKFDWKIARDLFKKPTLWLIFVQGFFGVFPWNVITFFFFLYLEKERGYTGTPLMVTMVVAVIVLAAGYPLGGALGDLLFKRTLSGRLIVSTIGVILGTIFLWFTMHVPVENQLLFMILLAFTAIFMPIAGPNVTATVYDITLPEIRSTSLAIESFVESIGAAFAPLITGFIADRSSIGNAILLICISAWILCAIFFVVAAFLVPKDIQVLRRQLQERATFELDHAAKE